MELTLVVQDFLEFRVRRSNLVSPVIARFLSRIDELSIEAQHGVAALLHPAVSAKIVVGSVGPGIISAQAACQLDQLLIARRDLAPGSFVELTFLRRTRLMNTREDDVLGNLVETYRLVNRR